MRIKLQFIAAENITICCVTVQAVRCARSHFTLSVVITHTEKLTVEVSCDKEETLKITRKPVYAAVMTTVSMQEFIPLHDKIIKNRQHCWENVRY